MVLHGYKKSRNGCARCKQRRVKCDEKKPCANCTRRGEDCDLHASETNRRCPECAAREATASNSASPADSTGNAQLFSPTDWSRDMYLMYHYSTFTCKELATDVTIRQLWQYEVLNEALKYPFLMHGLLAISALHLADKDPDSTAEYLPLLIHHQNMAISSFRNALARITKENCHAVLARAVVVSMSCKLFSCIEARRYPPYMPPLDDIIEPFILTRGVGEVIGAAAEWIKKGPLGPMLIGHRGPNAEQFELPLATKTHFQNMRDLFHRSVDVAKDLAALLEAIAGLERIYWELTMGDKKAILNPGTVWKWPNTSPAEYMLLLRQHHPQALLLYAHFTMLSEVYDKYWYFRYWGTQAVAVIRATLPPELQSWIQYPDFLKEKEALGMEHDIRSPFGEVPG